MQCQRHTLCRIVFEGQGMWRFKKDRLSKFGKLGKWTNIYLTSHQFFDRGIFGDIFQLEPFDNGLCWFPSIKMCKSSIKNISNTKSTFQFKNYLFHNCVSWQRSASGGCGSVSRAVASNSRGPWFESSHWQKFTINRIEKTKINKKEARNGPFLKKVWKQNKLPEWNIKTFSLFSNRD